MNRGLVDVRTDTAVGVERSHREAGAAHFHTMARMDTMLRRPHGLPALSRRRNIAPSVIPPASSHAWTSATVDLRMYCTAPSPSWSVFERRAVRVFVPSASRSAAPEIRSKPSEMTAKGAASRSPLTDPSLLSAIAAAASACSHRTLTPCPLPLARPSCRNPDSGDDLVGHGRGVPRFEAGGQVLGKHGVIEDAPIEPVLQARQVFALTEAAASSRAISRAAGASHPGCAVRVRIRSVPHGAHF